MRGWLGSVTMGLALVAGAWGCESRRVAPESEPAKLEQTTKHAAAVSALLQPLPAPAPLASATLAVSRSLQARALRLAPASGHLPRLVLGKGVVGQLGTDSLRVYSTRDGSSISTTPLEAPRAVLALADGSILALGSVAMLRVEPGHKPVRLPKPVVLPGVELFADAVQADRIWSFDARSKPPKLAGYRLAPGPPSVLLPEQELELEAPSGGVLGTTREGVWLYFTAGQVERFGPGGARLSRLTAPELPSRFLTLPTRRLDQQYLLDDEGRVTRALVTPLFRKLSERDLGVKPFGAAVGDAGRLLAVVAVKGEGPSFELTLFDEELALRGRAALPTEPPTGRDDWVQVVTRNLELAAAAREPLVAVGGPERVLIFDAAGKQVLSIPSR